MYKLLSIISIPFQVGSKTDAPHRFKSKRAVVPRVVSRPVVTSRTRGSQLMSFVISLALIVNLGLFMSYLYTVNAFANSGYAIKQMEKQIAGQDAKYKKMLVERSEANSMASVDEAVQSGAFVPVNAAELMFVTSGTLSQK